MTPAKESALLGQPEPQYEAAGELTPEEEGPVNAPAEAPQVEPMETADLGELPAPASAPSLAASEAEVVPSPEGRAVGAVSPVQSPRDATAKPLLEEGAVGPAPRSSPRREYLPYRPAYPGNDRYGVIHKVRHAFRGEGGVCSRWYAAVTRRGGGSRPTVTYHFSVLNKCVLSFYVI